MRADRIGWIVWSAVFIVTALRAIFDSSLPMTGDEAYYWEWSRRLAGGYADHPPAVAFAVAAFAWLGRTPFAVRFPFVLCGLLTAIVAAATARHLSGGDRRAGWIAALGVSLAPMLIVAFAMVSPDGPYALAWACSLYCAVRAFPQRRWLWFVLLGVALGAALLSRLFSLALVAGLIAAICTSRYRNLWPQFAVSLAVSLLVWSPFLFWNASHHWISFTFAIVERHAPEINVVRPFITFALCALAFSPGLWIAATVNAARTKDALILWTGVPLAVLFLLLSIHESVEVYWFIGPYLSLLVGFASEFAGWTPHRRQVIGSWILAPAIVLSAVLFIAGISPATVYAGVRHAGLRLNNGGPFEMFTYPTLAQAVRALTDRPNTYAMTDGYGFSSLLDFYGGLAPVLIGYDAQGQEARRWFSDANKPARALFVDKIPLARRPEFKARLSLACAYVQPGPVLSYPLAGKDKTVPPRRYFTTWCDGMRPNAISILRWENRVRL
ncbi:MAG TPA: glycosyltransferase family 39 protein [Candidatus Rubrimentiphilum sp.]|nr:glycosyltransferase family 39 protein [Candidatus Rubrimentiphilum sp.]